MSFDQHATAQPIAYHEAGHAVMALHLGTRRVVEIRLTPDDPSRGGVCSYGAVPPADPRHSILISLAGHAAEAVLLGRQPARRSDTDDRHAFEAALTLAGSPPAACRVVLELRERARAILSRADRWPAVVAVAEALHKRGRLDGGEVYRIAMGAIRRR